jgi:hypothetical protein
MLNDLIRGIFMIATSSKVVANLQQTPKAFAFIHFAIRIYSFHPKFYESQS